VVETKQLPQNHVNRIMGACVVKVYVSKNTIVAKCTATVVGAKTVDTHERYTSHAKSSDGRHVSKAIANYR
jgi:hypothetical protein